MEIKHKCQADNLLWKIQVYSEFVKMDNFFVSWSKKQFLIMPIVPLNWAFSGNDSKID